MKTEKEIREMLDYAESFRFYKGRITREWKMLADKKNIRVREIIGSDIAILKNREGIIRTLEWVLDEK